MASFARSLGWIAVLVACAIACWIIADIVTVDFIHRNANRSRSNAIAILLLFPVIYSICAGIGVALVLPLSQWLQAVVVFLGWRHLSRRRWLAVVLCVPVASVLTWYCYDYLTPSDLNLSINAGADWRPYQHGLTLQRYLLTLLCQAGVTAFSMLRFCADLRSNARLQRTVLLAAMFGAACCGALARILS